MDNFCVDTISIWKGIGEVIHVIRLVIPIIIVLLGTFDLGKAVIAGEDKEVKKSQKIFIKRLIYGIAIFFLPVIIKSVFSLFENNYMNSSSKVCYECATNVRGNYCSKYESNYKIDPIGTDDNTESNEQESLVEEDESIESNNINEENYYDEYDESTE